MKLKISIFLFVLLLIGLFIIPVSADTGWWNTSFTNREPITITTNGTSTPAWYQVLLNVTYNSAMQADFDDIRFTNSTGGTELPYWIESKVNGSYANVWVNLSDAITDPGSDTVWMYYGNAGLSDGGVGADTFLQWHGAATANYHDANITAVPFVWEGKFRRTSNTGWFMIGTSNTQISYGGDTSDSLSISPQDAIQHYIISHDEGVESYLQTSPIFTLNEYYKTKIVAVSSSSVVFHPRTIGTTYELTTNIPNEAMGLNLYLYQGASAEQEFSFIRKYIANEPTASYGTAQYYTDSLHYNATTNYNHTIESDGTITANHTVYPADDTNDTAASIGTSYITINVYDNAASIVRNFTVEADDLDWYQAANLSGSYTLNNASGVLETQSDIGGLVNFTGDLIAGDYWIEEVVGEHPVIELLVQTPDTLEQSSDGTFVQVWGISHTSAGLNNSSLAYTFGAYDVVEEIYKYNLRTPNNDKAAYCAYCDANILRGINRNESLTWENNATITGGDIYTWNGYDYLSSEVSIEQINATYTNVTITDLIRHQVFPTSVYLDNSDLMEAPKTGYPIHKTSYAVVKIWDNEAFLDHEHLGFIYVDAYVGAIPPTAAYNVEIFYLNASFDPTGAVHPDDSPYLFYLTSMNASDWIVNDYTPHTNSSYVNSIVVNSSVIEDAGINVTGEAYLYFRSDTASSKPFYINVTNVASSTNVSFADTGVLWSVVSTPFSITQESYTPNIFTSFIHPNMQYQSKLWVQDNHSVWRNSSLETTNIDVSVYPPSTPGFDSFNISGVPDYNMNSNYYDIFGICMGLSTDPDGGTVSHNLTLHYGNGTYVATINNTLTDEIGLFTCVEFNSTPYYSSIDNYTLKVVATDDELDTTYQWLGVNFTLSLPTNFTVDGTVKVLLTTGEQYPIDEATVSVYNGTILAGSVLTNESGYYEFETAIQNITVIASKYGYYSNSTYLELTGNTTHNILVDVNSLELTGSTKLPSVGLFGAIGVLLCVCSLMLRNRHRISFKRTLNNKHNK